jgi:hypothetical protein
MKTAKVTQTESYGLASDSFAANGAMVEVYKRGTLH